MKYFSLFALILSCSLFPVSVFGLPLDSRPIRVGFVYPGQVGAFGWSFQHDQGRRAVEEHFGDRVITSYVESVPSGADAEHALSLFARQGYDLVFAASFDFMDPTLTVAARFPHTRFENAMGYFSAPNVAVYGIRFHEGRAILGTIAAHVTRSNIIGYVAALPVPEVIRGINAFTLALRRLNPNAVVKVIFVNAWYDPGKERAVAERLVEMGADVLIQHTDSSVVVQLAEERGVMVFGKSSDMSRFGPNSQLTATVDHWGDYYIHRVQAVLDGAWEPGIFLGGVQSNMIRIAPFSAAVGPAARRDVYAMQDGLQRGTFFPFCGPVRNQAGALVVKEGECLTEARIRIMNWFVEGVQGDPGY
ncbi:BMP family ABC transporter substrate-binding protein [Haematospirillum jordaniae]|uniref:ABC transporter substrate-binding protein n=1 Tax=Haematospirillum jordaniae TaxID=1549855 RepID=A0A143DE70_9PROT|nr:BMP family ABC transporter substrate-binding protein [Haematospirillum jordaniae]AMW35025.1 ABC transporter substrate-binding protein [Haematospirillum jordaniae]NKD44238.1 BMP family ABC transporter substrate-binding protein [Haematospirillum jordaniae]NKD56616.1 BMP family ABC transporter substrate-binding protein [Haematospirillum jordaniae]NKD58674.1 BMP family ABC transporter substrate-binding protein [Haematospirillum jordaniae]NKD66157.1 BMP family ABC transporter substrate-binding p